MMRLPDAEGLSVALQQALRNVDVVFLHDAEGAPVAVALSMEFYRAWSLHPSFPPYDYTHDHIEPGEQVPWAFEKGEA